MIRGEVTADREAVIDIRVRNAAGQTLDLQAAVDTGFTEYLTLPPSIIIALALPFDSVVPMFLANKVRSALDCHTGWIEWGGSWKPIPVIRAEGAPLVGMSMFRGQRLTIDNIDGGSVTISPLP